MSFTDILGPRVVIRLVGTPRFVGDRPKEGTDHEDRR